ncbi:alpha/beta hydrolase-fold protein [Marinicella sp. W31]|uniref:alpha/beta hydrolase-fold protein n=1 Tax=Marinicella sp. W31 TaxID=3023713 RepID=UPI0037571289
MKIILCCLVSICMFKPAFSQSYHRIEESITSKILNEERPIVIMLPAKYDASHKLDVLYLTDAEMFQQYVVNILEFQHENNLVPPQIVVGIPNIWEWPNLTRDRDLTPVENIELPVVSGKADQFQDFIEQELIPYIDKKYPNNNKRTLLGHSYGGLFALYTFLTRPDLFDSYIASDPSCYFVNHYITSIAKKHLKQHNYVNKTVFIGGRSGQQHHDMGTQAFIAEIKQHTPKNLVWQDQQYKDEHHGSVRFKGFYDGLKFTFYGHNKDELEFHPMNGVLAKGQPIEVKTYSDNSLVRYTTDGSIPTRDSKQFAQLITIDKPSQMVAKFFSNRGEEQIIKAAFDYAPPLTMTDKPEGSKLGALNIQFSHTPRTDSSVATTKVFASSLIEDNDLPINNPSKLEQFSASITGTLHIKADGYHTFHLNSDNHAKFYLSDTLLLDYANGVNHFGSQSFVVPLKKGFYSLKLEYFHSKGRGWLDLTYRPPYLPPEHDPIKIPLQQLWASETRN